MHSSTTLTGRIIISLKETELLEEEKQLIANPHVAGIILFAQNYTGFAKQQLLKLIYNIQKTAIAAGKTSGIPIFADQEGGFVQRIGRGLKPLPAYYTHGIVYDLSVDTGLEYAKIMGNLMAKELSQFGIISLAPLLDLQLGNIVIEGLGRSFHKEPEICYLLADAYIDGMLEAGMQATGKHFPGHGLDIGDSHFITPIDNRSLTELEQKDLLPFIKLIKANKLAAIMPSHIIYPQIDPHNITGMSQIWINDLLKDKYGFTGITISDCLTMSGAGNETDLYKVKNTLKYLDIALLCHKSVEEYLSIFNELDASYFMNSHQAAAFMRWTKNTTKIALNLYNQYNTEDSLLESSSSADIKKDSYYQENGVSDPIALHNHKKDSYSSQ